MKLSKTLAAEYVKLIASKFNKDVKLQMYGLNNEIIATLTKPVLKFEDDCKFNVSWTNSIVKTFMKRADYFAYGKIVNKRGDAIMLLDIVNDIKLNTRYTKNGHVLSIRDMHISLEKVDLINNDESDLSIVKF